MIEIKNLTKTYGKKNILDDVNFTFPSNGLICVLGASGCGKSTLLNLLAGFDSDYSGEVIVYGTSLNKLNVDSLCSYRRDNIGFVFQNYNLLEGYTVLENILLSCGLSNGEDLENQKKAKDILKKLDMLDKENQNVENLSGGQKQRVAIARSLINNPSIVLADEPTGALDRKNSTEIMKLLKELSKERLVLLVTHDLKICELADKIISIKDGKIEGESVKGVSSKLNGKENNVVKVHYFRHAIKNLKVHFTRYATISLVISIGVLAFMMSLSSTNILKASISNFKEKNTAFNNGYVKGDKDYTELIELLENDNRVENVYKQYVINNVTLTFDKKSEIMIEKYPMPKGIETMSYGVMPKAEERKIALSPSLAKKFQNDIDKLIGQELVLRYREKEYKLTISGIFNAGYDDFFVSSDIEQNFYQHIEDKNPYSISYDVKNFEDIVFVHQMLEDKGIESQTAVKEVKALQTTFDNLNNLFFVISILILSIGLFIGTTLLMKLQNSRYREVGLLSALGFNQKQIREMIVRENILLSGVAVIFNVILTSIVYFISIAFQFDLMMTLPQMLLSFLGTGIIVILISILATFKLIHTEPAVALRK